MAKFRKIYPSFAGGAQTPKLAARVDLQAYGIGADEMVNFIVMPQGGFFNRAGTKPLANTAYRDVRLVPFVYGEDDSLCLVFSDRTVDVFNESGYVHTIDGSPYTGAHLDDLRWLQSADILYLFHGDVPVHKLMRYGNTDWKWRQVGFKGGPYRDVNTDEGRTLHLYVVNLANPGDPAQFRLRVGSNWDFFTADMVGMKIRMEIKIKAGSKSVTLSRNGPTESGIIMPFGAFTAESTGKWFGEVRIMKKLPEEDAFTAVKTYTSQEDYNFQYIDAVDEYGTEFKFEFDGASSNYPGIEIKWDWVGGIINREFTIAGYVTRRIVYVEADDGILSGIPPTPDWAIGAFGPTYGYPALGIFHQERLILANTRTDPQTMWMSQPASWEDFGTNIPAEDTDGIMATLAARQVNEIRGFSSRQDLLIFTGGAEWVAQAGSKSDVFTPSSIVVTPSSYRGSANIEPLDIGPSVFFAQRHGKVVRGMGYEENIGGYTTSEVTVMAEHLFEDSSLSRWCYQQEPWSIVWFVMADGTVRALSVQQEHQVSAWSEQDFGAPVRDVCSIPGQAQDRVFLAVERNGALRIEILNVRDDRNYTATMFMDGGVSPVKSVFLGKQIEEQVDMTLQGKHKQLPYGTIRVYRTCGFRAGMITENGEAVDPVRFPGDASPRNRTEPYTGDIHVEWPGGVGRRNQIRIENETPHPVTILGIFPEVEVNAG